LSFIRSIFNKIFNWGFLDLQDSNKDSKQVNVKLNPFSLKFPEPIESDYLKFYYKNSVLQINISTIAGALLFSSFFLFDLFLVPELFLTFFLLRVVLGSLIITTFVISINKIKNKKASQPLLSLAIILIAAINISFIVLAYPKLNSTYYIGIILIYFWSYTFLKLRYIWAAISGLSIFFLYQLTVLFFIPLKPELYLISSSYLFASNLAGIGIAYTLEYYSRNNFFNNLKIKISQDVNVSLTQKIAQSDKAIGLAEEKLKIGNKALESTANSVIILNRDGTIIWSNSAFSQLTGYDPEEIIGKNPRFLQSGKHDKIFYKNLWSTILRGQVWSGEIINKKKNGDLYYEEMVITPVVDNTSDKITHFIAIKQDISLRKSMEHELFESEKRLRNLFENATVGIYRCTLDGEILMANNALVKMLGFESLEDLKQRGATKAGYLDPSKRDEFVRLIKESGSIIGLESDWQKRDGSIIHVRESARLDVDESNQTIFEGTIEDITLNKLAEGELRESRERLQTVFDNMYDAIFIHDLNGKIFDVNNKVLDLFNISVDEALKMSIQDLFSKSSSRELASKYWTHVINKGKTYKFEWKAIRPMDKYVFDVEIFLSKITLGNDNYILANVRDISDQKEANKKLLITQKAFELNATPIFWITNDSKFTYANKAASEVLGYTLDELKNMKVSDIDMQWTDEFWKNSGYPMLQEKRVAQFESVCKKNNGELFPTEISASIINFENEEIIIAILTDITERKRTAENLIKAKEKAEQSDKLKSEFLAGMSHEIRTPINTILNFISLIRSDLGPNVNDDIKSSFEMIDNGSRRLIRTIDSIINMSQLQAGSYDRKMEIFSIVDDVLEPLYKEFKQTAGQKNLDFHFETNLAEQKILADHYTLSQLFINLIDNAIKYTHEGSVKLTVSASEDIYLISVIDTGVGISDEFLPTLFEPFLQEEMGYTRSFEGNGLGLALVKKYLELNNGTIDVKSKKGEGSSFTAKLPKPNNNELNKYNALKVLDRM